MSFSGKVAFFCDSTMYYFFFVELTNDYCDVMLMLDGIIVVTFMAFLVSL